MQNTRDLRRNLLSYQQKKTPYASNVHTYKTKKTSSFSMLV